MGTYITLELVLSASGGVDEPRPKKIRIKADWPEGDPITIESDISDEVRLIDELLGRFEADRSKLADDELDQLGNLLGDCLFSDRRVEQLLFKLEGGAGKSGDIIRIRLVLDNPALAELPWEYLRREGLEVPRVALHPRFSIIRSWSEEGATRPSFRAERPDLVRVAYASATQELGEGWTPLPVGGLEFGALTKKFDKSIHFQRLGEDPVTIEDLNEDFVRPVDIFHFTGHGSSSGHLVLGGATKRTDCITADQLGKLLKVNDVQLAVIAACNSAKPMPDAWGGLATTLGNKQWRIPAVLAMQGTFGDENGNGFARAFYEAIARNGALDDLATVEEAISAGRRAIAASPDWGMPVLYTRASETPAKRRQPRAGKRDNRRRPAMAKRPPSSPAPVPSLVVMPVHLHDTVQGPWAAMTIGGHLYLLESTNGHLSTRRFGSATALDLNGTFGAGASAVYLTQDGSAIVASGPCYVEVGEITVAGDVQPWQRVFPTLAGQILAARRSGPAVELMSCDGTTVKGSRLDDGGTVRNTTIRGKANCGVALEETFARIDANGCLVCEGDETDAFVRYPIKRWIDIDASMGASVTLIAAVGVQDDQPVLQVTRTVGNETLIRATPLDELPERVRVARAPAVRDEPTMILVQTDERLSAWSWDEIPEPL
jgi:hypothetical protein